MRSDEEFNYLIYLYYIGLVERDDLIHWADNMIKNNNIDNETIELSLFNRLCTSEKIEFVNSNLANIDEGKFSVFDQRVYKFMRGILTDDINKWPNIQRCLVVLIKYRMNRFNMVSDDLDAETCSILLDFEERSDGLYKVLDMPKDLISYLEKHMK
jgi:hypothetical protein